jgi:PilZ domain
VPFRFSANIDGAAGMTWGNRKSDRVRFEHFCDPVNIVAIDGTWRRQCFLRDVSSTGARIEIEGSTDVFQAKEFFLILSTTGTAFRRCELVWINGMTVGVHFITENTKKKKKSPPASQVH